MLIICLLYVINITSMLVLSSMLEILEMFVRVNYLITCY